MVPAVSSLTSLPPIAIAGHEPTSTGNDNHPMRQMTRRAAGLAGPPWDAEAIGEVARLFDELAAEWHTRTTPERFAVFVDALDRGIPAVAPERSSGGTVLEIGSGVGAYSGLLAERYDRVLAIELSMEMIRLAAPSASHSVMADASVLPVPDAVADVVVLVNMFLFPTEVDRTLAPDGVVVWVNSSGENTPIHLRPDEVAEALPGSWTGVESRAGEGLWAVLRRA
jgi:SAM-dependent methyltransferase